MDSSIFEEESEFMGYNVNHYYPFTNLHETDNEMEKILDSSTDLKSTHCDGAYEEKNGKNKDGLNDLRTSRNNIEDQEKNVSSEEYSSYYLGSEVDQNQNRASPQKRKTRKIKKNDYPTKNLLQTCSTCHYNFLLSKEKDSDSEIRALIQKYVPKKKTTMSRSKFLELYREEKLQPLWKQYFQSKQIYRDILFSRTRPTNLLYFFQRLHVFEVAFYTKTFDRINE